MRPQGQPPAASPRPPWPRSGTDTRLPFECPADFVFHIPYMDLEAPALDYRLPGFLQRPQVRSPPCVPARLGWAGRTSTC